MKAPIAIIVFLTIGFNSFGQSNDLTLLSTGNFTKPSLGYQLYVDGVRGPNIVQGDKAVAGFGVGYRRLFTYTDGLKITYLYAPSNSKLSWSGGFYNWPVARHEFDVEWVHRWQYKHAAIFGQGGISPILLNGGNTKTGSGFDGQLGAVFGGGADYPVSKHLGIEVGIEEWSGSASDYGEDCKGTTYHPSWTVFTRPTTGLVWEF
jgi:hypothetical protein